MAEFAKKSDLLVGLRDNGEAFLESTRTNFSDRNREQDDNYKFCRLTPDEKLLALGKTVISELTEVPGNNSRHTAMNEPVFTWNGSVTEPVISNTGNHLVNTSECFPPALMLLATDYVDKGYGSGKSIYDQFVRKVGALFLCEATPRDFQIDASRQGVGLYFRDPKQANLEAHDHIAKGSLLYNLMKDGNFPAFDIHDIAHHASQLGMYSDFYKWLTAHATEEIMSKPENLRQRRLLRCVLLTSLEHSVVAAGDGVQSFGCLNWQSPRKSVLGRGVAKGPNFNVNDYAFGARDFNRWSAIRAIASIYREQIESEELLSTKLNWMGAMGYGMDKELLAIVRPFQSYDYSVFAFDTAQRATLQVPASPQELFARCRQLVEEEFARDGAASKQVPETTGQTRERTVVNSSNGVY